MYSECEFQVMLHHTVGKELLCKSRTPVLTSVVHTLRDFMQGIHIHRTKMCSDVD